MSGYQLLTTVKKVMLSRKYTSLEVWLFSIFFGNIIVLASYNFYEITSYITGALTFSFIFYLLMLFLFLNKKKRSVIFNNKEKYADNKFSFSDANKLIDELNSIMNEEQLFKNANLKSSELAKKIQLTTHQLSQLLNDNLGKNFSSFVNEYRINEAKKMLLSNGNITLEAIGYECGFNSKSTFYTTFKKIVGKTPSQYKSSNL